MPVPLQMPVNLGTSTLPECRMHRTLVLSCSIIFKRSEHKIPTKFTFVEREESLLLQINFKYNNKNIDGTEIKCSSSAAYLYLLFIDFLTKSMMLLTAYSDIEFTLTHS